MFKKIGTTSIMDDDLMRIDRIPSGMYEMTTVSKDGRPVLGIKEAEAVERLIRFNHGPSIETIARIGVFKESGHKYRSMGICHKVGIVWHGPPGTGKTCAARLMMNDLCADGAICIDCTGYNFEAVAAMCKHIRKAQDNLVVAFMDECEGSINGESALHFLDGVHSVEGVVFLGCTNFIDRIHDRVKNRPSRLRYLIEVDRMPYEVLLSFISGKCPDWSVDDAQKAAYMACEAKLNLDEAKNALIEVEVYGKSIEDAMKWNGVAAEEPEEDDRPRPNGLFDHLSRPEDLFKQ